MARAYDVDAVERKWQAALARRGHLRGGQRRPAPALLRPVHVPVPVGPGPPGPRAQLHLRRPGGPLPDDAGPGRALAARLRLLRPAGRERGDPDRHPPPRVHRGPHRRAARSPSSGSARSTTGAARSAATTRPTSAGTSSSSCGCSRPAWPTGPSAPVNWCPGCQTVLANEQVLADGTCERSGDLVVNRDLEQWFFRITALRRRAAGRAGRAGVARAGEDHAAQLDRPLRGGRARPRRWWAATAPTAGRPSACGSSPPGRTPASA